MANIAATLPSRILLPHDPAPVRQDRQGPFVAASVRPTPKDLLQDNRPRPEGPVANPLLVQLFSQASGGEAQGGETTNGAAAAANQKTGIAAYRSAQSVIPPQPPAPEDSGLLVVQDHPAIDLTV